jgi:hypothetical protein
MKDINALCIGFAEINTSMKGFRYQRWNDVTRKIFRVSRMVQSESDIITNMEYKPGGTLTAVVDKWQAQITKTGNDKRGLGRWSYVILSSNKQKLAIITAYKPCKTTGPNTAWTQQWLMLREKQKDPDPTAEFNKDLQSLLQQWRAANIEVILLIDANKEIGVKPGGLSGTIT